MGQTGNTIHWVHSHRRFPLQLSLKRHVFCCCLQFHHLSSVGTLIRKHTLPWISPRLSNTLKSQNDPLWEHLKSFNHEMFTPLVLFQNIQRTASLCLISTCWMLLAGDRWIGRQEAASGQTHSHTSTHTAKITIWSSVRVRNKFSGAVVKYLNTSLTTQDKFTRMSSCRDTHTHTHTHTHLQLPQ